MSATTMGIMLTKKTSTGTALYLYIMYVYMYLKGCTRAQRYGRICIWRGCQ